MFEIVFVRHGQTEWNSRRHVMGRRPVPLNETGRAQAEGVAGYLADAKIDAILSSPVERAMETARIIASRHEGLEVEQEESVIEIDYGEWNDCTFEDLPIKFAEVWKRYRVDPAECTFPGGESIRDAAARITAGMDRLMAREGAERAVVVSHADVLKIALVHVLGLDLKQMARFGVDNCAVILVRFFRETGPRMILANASMGFGMDMRISELVPMK